MIKIIDNFLDKEVFKKLQSFLSGNAFPWFYNESKVIFDKNKKPFAPIKGYPSDNPHQFIHGFYDTTHTWSQWTCHLAPLLDKIKPRAWIRIKANLESIYSKSLVGGWHYDKTTDGVVWTDTTTSIFFVNTNNGYTIFENGKKVPSIENRLVTFPNNILHTGVSQTNTKTRITLNLNYLK